MHDVTIVGAGPAGTSAALWLKQLGYSPLLIDRNDQCGGLQLLNSYTNTWIATSSNVYGKDVADAMHRNMLDHKVEMRLGVSVTQANVQDGRVQLSLSNGSHFSSKFLILATGVTAKDGGFKNRLGMIIGSGPAIANTNFSGKRVAILGGGDSAFENYAFVCERGAGAVRIFARSLRARVEMLERVSPQNVTVGEFSVDDEHNRVNGEQFDCVLIMFGYAPAKDGLLGLDIAMRPDGFVVTDQDCRTSNSSVFACGEIAQRGHPCCVTSMADGVAAAKAIQRLIEADRSSRYLGMARRSMAFTRKVAGI